MRQHERLRVPQGWEEQDKALIIQLNRLLDDIYVRFETKYDAKDKADKSEAITNITRSGTTFTATRADGSTFTFTQQDNSYPTAITDITRNGTTFTATRANGTTFTFTQQDNSYPTAITNITRSGTTFTATRANGTTFTFTQQDNDHYAWGDITGKPSNVGSANRGIYLNGTTFTPVSWYPSSCSINGGNTANFPWHRIATCTTGTGQYVDRSAIVIINSRYNGGPYGVLKIAVRTNGSGTAMNSSAVWLFRYGFAVNDVKITSGGTTGTDTRFNVWLKCGTWPRRIAYLLEGSNNGWSLISSNEPDNCTAASHGTEINASVSGADATDATVASAGDGIKTITRSGTTFTVTRTNGTTFTFTQQDNNTDTNTWRPVQNNLTSTSTTDCLSAYQGKVLNDKLAGKMNTGKLTRGDNNWFWIHNEAGNGDYIAVRAYGGQITIQAKVNGTTVTKTI